MKTKQKLNFRKQWKIKPQERVKGSLKTYKRPIKKERIEFEDREFIEWQQEQGIIQY
jgi:hypothetical protein